MSRGKAAGQDCLGRGSPNLPLYLCRKQQLGGEAEGPSILVLEGGVSSERKPPCTSALKLEGSPPRGRAWDCSQGSSPLCGGSDVSGCTGATSALARCGRSPSSSGVAWRGVPSLLPSTLLLGELHCVALGYSNPEPGSSPRAAARQRALLSHPVADLPGTPFPKPWSFLISVKFWHTQYPLAMGFTV